MEKKLDLKKIFEFTAYIGTGCVAVALLMVAIFKGNGVVSQVFSNIGQAIAYIITMIVAGFFVKKQKHVAWLICYVVFVVAITILYILGLVL